MIYPPDYFDDCNGLIPQIVLCVALLEAGNEKQKAFPSAFFKDVSDSATWSTSMSSDGQAVLSLSGYLPLVESRYLLGTDSIVERVNSLNSYNVGLVADGVGAPFAGIANNSLQPVILPAGIEHLSTEPRTIERRLAYLLLQLEKRNNLYALNNALRYIYISSLTDVYEVVQDGGIKRYQTVGRFIWKKIVDLVFFKIVRDYPLILNIIFNDTFTYENSNKLEYATNWLKLQLLEDEIKYIPRINLQALVDEATGEITEMKALPDLQSDTTTANNDVSSEISGSSNSRSTGWADGWDIIPPWYMPWLNGGGDGGDSSGGGGGGGGGWAPFEPEKPETNDNPLNSLPDC